MQLTWWLLAFLTALKENNFKSLLNNQALEYSNITKNHIYGSVENTWAKLIKTS